MNIIFMAIGALSLLAADFYLPWHLRWQVMRSTFPGVYRAHLKGDLPRRPAWSWALQALGFGLLVLGFWRQWSGV